MLKELGSKIEGTAGGTKHQAQSAKRTHENQWTLTSSSEVAASDAPAFASTPEKRRGKQMGIVRRRAGAEGQQRATRGIKVEAYEIQRTHHINVARGVPRVTKDRVCAHNCLLHLGGARLSLWRALKTHALRGAVDRLGQLLLDQLPVRSHARVAVLFNQRAGDAPGSVLSVADFAADFDARLVRRDVVDDISQRRIKVVAVWHLDWSRREGGEEEEREVQDKDEM